MPNVKEQTLADPSSTDSSEKRVAEQSFEAMNRLSRDNRARISSVQKEFDDVSELLKQMALLKQLHQDFSGSASTSG